MSVQVAERGQVDHPLRDDPPVSHHNDGLRLRPFQLRAEFCIVLDGLGLHDLQPMFRRTLFDGSWRDLLSAATRTVRLGNYEPYLVSGCDEGIERGNGELRSAAKDYIHSPAFCSFLILFLIKFRLSALMCEMKSFPFRWSVSCRKARASSASPVISNVLPFRSCARTVTLLARVTRSRNSGRLRQPSPPLCFPSVLMISGFTSTSFAPASSLKLVSITAMRLPMPTCGAAKPTPCAAYIDSNISSASFSSSLSNVVTVAAGVSSTVFPNLTMG